MTKNAKKRQNSGAGKGGTVPPKSRQFGQPNGNKRGHGFWKKEDTPRYKLEQMMKLNEVELSGISEDLNLPFFDRQLAKCILNGKWKEIESMINQVYGFPKQEVEQTNVELTPILPKRRRGNV